MTAPGEIQQKIAYIRPKRYNQEVKHSIFLLTF